ncbi:single-stranded DNA-binding protein [Lactobacillus sp. M0398]|uniref:single-stranded DNA-binding protein n=1 Tax=unclassified Lactobacillus TaxID=2620435 RepID=UPI0018DC4DCF|nr:MULTISPECIES: single-stranded DNA-binding protein [unclassified Lactobacillus]MBI0121802.1 single-stranded DNA-binding protein [Lactobacillus sp. M0398]MBI0122103.1 single-stranded DNA-binding protein [Lactobacillus sp. W8174]MBI0134833.1 single-stranded DNA-binding protein [Lactobacillus sp. W8173]
MINRAVLTGRLTKDAELRTTQSGLSVATFTLAVNRHSKAKGDADFINCVIWRKAAENFCNFTSKGSLVGIDGRIQTRNYDDKDGKKVYVTEVVVDNFALLESKKDRQNNNTGSYANNSTNGNYSKGNNGANYDNNSQDPFNSTGDTIDISDDDLPF